MQHLNFQAYFQMHLLNFLTIYSWVSVLIVCFVHFKLHMPAKRLKIKRVTNLQIVYEKCFSSKAVSLCGVVSEERTRLHKLQ